MKNQLFILMVLTVSLSSCRKEKIVKEYITKDDHSWNSHEKIDQSGTYVFGVSKFQNALYILTNKYMLYYDGNSYINYPSFHNQFTTNPAIFETKMLQINYLDRMYFIDYAKSYVGDGIDTSKIIDYLSNARSSSLARPYSAINDKNNQCFTLYNSSASQPKDSIRYAFFMFRITTKIGVTGATDYISSSFMIPKKPFYITAAYAHFGNYFITSSDGIMLIDSSANSKMVLNIDNGDVVQSLFRTENTLYAMSNYFMYRSDDYGMTWIKAYAISSQLGQFLFTNVDGEIFGYGYDNLIQMKITPDSLDIKTIYNKGLKNRNITGIVKYNSDIIVTTTAGTYIKPYIDLFYKE